MVHFFELLGNKSFVRVLKYFLENPSAEKHAAQIQSDVKIAKKSVFDALAKLASIKLLKERRVGRAILYSLAQDSVLAKQLKTLLNVSSLFSSLEKISEKISGVEVYLYGSAARGENTEASDVDILVIGPRAEKAREAQRALASPRNKIIVFTPLEYSALSRKDKALYESIERDKIKLI